MREIFKFGRVDMTERYKKDYQVPQRAFGQTYTENHFKHVIGEIHAVCTALLRLGQLRTYKC